MREGFDKAQADARQALALAPDLAQAHLALAAVAENGTLDFTQASEAYERALALAPGNAEVLRLSGVFEALMEMCIRDRAWIAHSRLKSEDFLFPSRIHASPHLSTRQYARIVDSWVQQLGLDTTSYDTQTLRRTKATLIYRRTKNLRAVQLLLGHTKLESTVRYLGIEVDDALEMAEQTEV